MGRLTAILQKRSPVLWIMAPDQTVAEAVEILAGHQIGAVPIVASGRLVGIFSERDLLRRVLAAGRAPAKTRLGDVMTPDPFVARIDEPIHLVLAKMRAKGLRHLPVLDVAGRPVGTISIKRAVHFLSALELQVPRRRNRIYYFCNLVAGVQAKHRFGNRSCTARQAGRHRLG